MQSNTSSYDWLRDHNWPHSVDKRIITHLENENKTVEEFFSPLDGLKKTLFEEIKSRIAEDDCTVPIKIGSHLYHSEIKAGNSYWVHYRTDLDGNNKTVLLDENLLAQQHEFFRLGALEISPDYGKIAYSVDYNGSERYQVFVQEIDTGKILDSSVIDVFAGIVWNGDSRSFFYLPAGENWRSDRLMYHVIGDPVQHDRLLYRETDHTFRLSIDASSSKCCLMINISSSNSNEIAYINITDPTLNMYWIAKRKEDVLYEATHHSENFYIIANDKGRNFRLLKLKIGEVWEQAQEMIAHSKDLYLTAVTAYKQHLVVEYKKQGLAGIKVINLNHTPTTAELKFEHESYSAWHMFTDFDYPTVRYQYSSLATPPSVFEYDVATHQSILLKAQNIPAGLNSADYTVRRTWFKSDDGTMIPVSLLWKNSLFKQDGGNPLYLYGYGSYGIAVPAGFRASVFSLVDRGFVYAIAHIRGGDDLGYEWYESAKFLNKKRTFEDFIAVAQGLIEQRYTGAQNIVISGGSAGGMLVGYSVNAAPGLFKAAVMHVPFVDVLSTMLDDSLPLTPGEFKEWGNPKNPEYYDYIKSYSPFDNIKKQAYPHLFVTAGLFDPRVTYWEPAKFVHKLRENKTSESILLLKTNMSAGHAGQSGRYDALKEIAEEFTFILKVLEQK
jgi:oligopeptidase B